MSTKEVTVNLGDPAWSLFQPVSLPGWRMIGTVRCGEAMGALGQNNRTGQFRMFNAGAARSLPQQPVRDQIYPAGEASHAEA